MSQFPLAGLRIVITRPEGEGAARWAEGLRAAGALIVLYPTIVLVPPKSWEALDQALARLNEYDWIVLTSQTAVANVLGRLPGQRFPAGMRAKIAVVGPACARMIEDAGRRVDYLPRETTQEGLLDGFRALPPGTRVLFPVATGGRTLFGDSLRARGCLVDVLHVYDTIPRRTLPSLPDFDVATFASPSALLSFVDHHGASALDRKRVVVIGPTTARQAETSGLDAVVALSTDVDALISAIAHARPPEGEH